MTLPYDVARCPNGDCHLSHNCLRWLSPGHPDRQVFTAFPMPKPGEACPDQMPAQEEQT